MKLSRATVSLYLGLVFVSGSVLGVVGDRYYNAHVAKQKSAENKGKNRRPRLTPEEWLDLSIKYQQDRLKLTDEQVRQLRIIYDETRLAFEDLDRGMQPQREAIAAKQAERIKTILNDEQDAEYEKMRKERDEMMRKGKNGKGNKRGGFPGQGF